MVKRMSESWSRLMDMQYIFNTDASVHRAEVKGAEPLLESKE